MRLTIKPILSAVAVALCILSVTAQDSENTLLWKIEDNNIDASYLFGTFHLLPKSDLKIGKNVKDALNGSEQLVLEIAVNDSSIISKFVQHVGMQDNMTLDQLLDKDDYEALDAKLHNAMGTGIAPFNHWKPMLITTLLYEAHLKKDRTGYEQVLAQIASDANIGITGLETIEEQLGLFDSIPYEEQVKDIELFLNKEDSMKNSFRKLIDLYKTEDIDEMHRLTTSYLSNQSAASILLYHRNKEWIPQIKNLVNKQSVFIGVGAAHLGSEKGLINLLRAEGYQVTPVFKD